MQESTADKLILVVEDNPKHLLCIKNALNADAVRYKIVAIADGTQVMNFLHHTQEFIDARRPDLILLDLNLSGKDGREILAEIKSDAKLKRIPIVILTTSDSEEDVFLSYTLQGNCYVIKSSDLNQLAQIVKRIEEFWLGIVTLPVE
jgi:chemotaxis family two-component system response regulator Rcp1